MSKAAARWTLAELDAHQKKLRTTSRPADSKPTVGDAKPTGIPAPLEHDIQSAFFDWIRLVRNVQPVLQLVRAWPNGGYRHAKTANDLQDEGVEAGPPDVWLPAPRQGFTGLVIEFKRPGKKPTTIQREYADRLIAEGWKYEVCTDSDTAINIVRHYLKA